jgi:hypothetical protein
MVMPMVGTVTVAELDTEPFATETAVTVTCKSLAGRSAGAE